MRLLTRRSDDCQGGRLRTESSAQVVDSALNPFDSRQGTEANGSARSSSSTWRSCESATDARDCGRLAGMRRAFFGGDSKGAFFGGDTLEDDLGNGLRQLRASTGERERTSGQRALFFCKSCVPRR